MQGIVGIAVPPLAARIALPGAVLGLALQVRSALRGLEHPLSASMTGQWLWIAHL